MRQRVERRHLGHVAHAGARPGAVDHRRQRPGLQVPRGRDAVRDERARGPLLRHHGPPALALASLEAPGEAVAFDRHRRGEAPDVDRRLDRVAGQGLRPPRVRRPCRAASPRGPRRRAGTPAPPGTARAVRAARARTRARRARAPRRSAGRRGCRRTSARGCRARDRVRSGGRRGGARSARPRSRAGARPPRRASRMRSRYAVTSGGSPASAQPTQDASHSPRRSQGVFSKSGGKDGSAAAAGAAAVPPALAPSARATEAAASSPARARAPGASAPPSTAADALSTSRRRTTPAPSALARPSCLFPMAAAF